MVMEKEDMLLEKIVKIEELDERDAVDIEVNGNHLFYANDILTHNSNSDVELTDTSESFGLPATADIMIALINTEELEEQGVIMVKQLKNRYADPTTNKRFMIGVDRARMKLFDLEDPQAGLTDSGASKYDETPVFDRKNLNVEKDYGSIKF